MANTGTVVETRQELFDQVRRPVRSVTLAWTSDASGNVTYALTGGGAAGSPGAQISGYLERVVFVPGTGGDQPTNLYSVTLKDANGIDMLAGQGASLANNANTHVKPSVPMKDGTTTSTAPIALDDVLTLGVSAAGNAKQGTVILYVR